MIIIPRKHMQDFNSYYERMSPAMKDHLKAIFKCVINTKEGLFKEMYNDLGSKYLSHPLKKAVDQLHDTKYTIYELRFMPKPIGLTPSEAIVWAELKKYDMIKKLNEMSPEEMVSHNVQLNITDW